MRERDESRHLAVGAGAPSDPDARDPGDAGDAGDAGDPGDDRPTPTPAAAPTDRAPAPDPFGQAPTGDRPDPSIDGAPGRWPRPATDVVQAVADFLDDLVDDPTFADDPHHTHCTRTPHAADLTLDPDDP